MRLSLEHMADRLRRHSFAGSSRRRPAASWIAIGALLLMAAGCRGVLGIHAARSGFDSGVMDPSTDPDAGDPDSGVAAREGGQAEAASGGRGAGGKGGAGAGGAPAAGRGGSNSGSGTGGDGSGSGGVSSSGSGGGGSGGGGSGGTSGVGGIGGASGNGTAGEPSCSDVCSIGDLQCISSTALQVCGIVDGCAVWTTITPCGDRELCSESGTTATCTCQPPAAGCEAGPGSSCASSTLLETCIADADGCIYKAAPTTCPAGKPCSKPYPDASCSCDEPSECSGVIGDVCVGTTQVVTCERNTSGCLAVATSATCPSGTSCSGAAGGASCKCPAPPAACMGATAGNVCTSDTSFTHCTSDGNGCVTATVGSCNALKPCRGNAGSADCTCLNPPPIEQCPADMRDGSRCVGASLLRCGNDAASCPRFSQTECASGVCGGRYPNAACVSEQQPGWPTDLGSMQEHITGALAGTKIAVPASAVLRRFGIISRTAGTHAILVLYDDQAGKPNNRIAATSSTTLVAGVNELAVTLPPAPVTLSAGTYWLMLSVDASTQIAHGSAPVPLAYVSYSHGAPIPSPLTTVAIDEMPELNFYIVVLPQ